MTGKIYIFLLSLLLAGCSPNRGKDSIVVAEVGLKKLYASDIADVIPDETNKEDSIVMADDYIRKWVKQELIVLKAEENLTADQKDLTREIQEYRNSLITYKYKNELMKQRMDTLVTDVQIEDYFINHTEDFKLSRNIVRAIFIKVPNEVANPAMIKSYCSDTSTEGLDIIREYCVQYAKSFDMFNNSWVDFEVVVKNIPMEIEDPEHFLPRNDMIELKDSNYYYLVSIQDYRLRNEDAPLGYVKENIRELILNRRKIEFLKQLEENIYAEGTRMNKFKIYIQKTDEEN